MTSHPSTRSRVPVIPPPTIMETSHLPVGTPPYLPGLTAPRWLEDILTGDLQSGHANVGCAGPDMHGVGRHELLTKGHQTYKQGVQEAYRTASDALCDELYACYCHTCRHHFTFYVWRAGAPELGDTSTPRSCGRSIDADPFHHLVLLASADACPPNINQKYYPYLGGATYACSAERCALRVTLEVSAPRLGDEFMSFLRDKGAILERRAAALAADRERFAEVATMPADALSYLRFYLRDIVDAKTGADQMPLEMDRKIDKRNKKFAIQFGTGPVATALFQFLEFQPVLDEGREMWRLPMQRIPARSQPGTQLAFFEDVRIEIETVLMRVKRSFEYVPTPALPDLRAFLDFGDYTQSSFAESREYAAEDYACLGLLPDMHEAVFWWAFRCQAQTCPHDELRFLRAVERLARGRNNDELTVLVNSLCDAPTPSKTSRKRYAEDDDDDDGDIKRAKALSLEDAKAPAGGGNGDGGNGGNGGDSGNGGGTADIDADFRFFGLSPTCRSEDEVASKFAETLQNAFASQKTGYRARLLRIAASMGSDALEIVALTDFTRDEALAYLDVEVNTDPSYMINMAEAAVRTMELDPKLVAASLVKIAEVRGPSAAKELTDAADLFQIGAAPAAGMASAVQPEPEPEVRDPALPVGLVNLRNTCYLNSILQYLFTVRRIRDIVGHYEAYALPDTPESLAARRIEPGQNTLTHAEAYAGRQFVRQLAALFSSLATSDAASIAPSQRLALGALKNASQLEADGRRLLQQQALGQNPTDADADAAMELPFFIGPQLPGVVELPADGPPPLPRRPNEAPPGSPASIAANASDTASIRSIQSIRSIRSTDTLVDLPDLMETDAEGTDDDELGETYEDANDAPAEHLIEVALNDTSVSGTDQQDVEEVFGNILSHLRAAVCATGEDADVQMQTDPITDTFYWTSATYTRKTAEAAAKSSRLMSPARVMTAYPDETRVISLEAALDRSFRREVMLDSGLVQFTAIVKLPPVLHIQIQRTTNTGTKLETGLAIPQRLRLDRFMDAAEDTELFRRRRRAWNLEEQLAAWGRFAGQAHMAAGSVEAEATAAASAESVAAFVEGDTMDAMDTMDAEYEFLDADVQSLMAQAGVTVSPGSVELEPTVSVEPDTEMGPVSRAFIESAERMTDAEIATAAGADADADDAETGASLLEVVTREAEAAEAELATLFDGLADPAHEYVLHAVVCHMGSNKAGHYWVWVHDFARGVWRRYNDRAVTEERDTAAVLAELAGGLPYYLAYVRASEAASLVDVPLQQEPFQFRQGPHLSFSSDPQSQQAPQFAPPPTPPDVDALAQVQAQAAYYDHRLQAVGGFDEDVVLDGVRPSVERDADDDDDVAMGAA